MPEGVRELFFMATSLRSPSHATPPLTMPPSILRHFWFFAMWISETNFCIEIS